MELREWLIILGLALVSLIVVDGVRRLQRQRRVPRLDQAVKDLPTAKLEELDDEAKEAEINWELPNGGARVVKPADYSGLGQKPKLERQEHPGPSRDPQESQNLQQRNLTRRSRLSRQLLLMCQQQLMRLLKPETKCANRHAVSQVSLQLVKRPRKQRPPSQRPRSRP
jgi:FtsZ-interacting cell division protein ZipA